MDKMAAISQTTLSIFMTEKFCIAIQLPRRFVPKGPIDNVSIGSGNGWAPNRWQAITWTNADPGGWRICAALGEDELKCCLGIISNMFSWPYS